MVRSSAMQMRLQLLYWGEQMGFPRLPYRFGGVIRSGEDGWDRFIQTAHRADVAAAYKVAEVRTGYLGEGSAVAAVVSSTSEDGAGNAAKAPAPRRGGRQKGSKNKPKASAPLIHEELSVPSADLPRQHDDAEAIPA